MRILSSDTCMYHGRSTTLGLPFTKEGCCYWLIKTNKRSEQLWGLRQRHSHKFINQEYN